MALPRNEAKENTPENIKVLVKELVDRNPFSKEQNQSLLASSMGTLAESSMLTSQQVQIAQERYRALVERYRKGKPADWYWAELENLKNFLTQKKADYQRTNKDPRKREPSQFEYALRLFISEDGYFNRQNPYAPDPLYGINLQELLACLWLALKDPDLPLIPQYHKLSKSDQEKLKTQTIEQQFVDTLYNIRTEHSKDTPGAILSHERSDFKNDNPSCLAGTLGRMMKIMVPISPLTTIADLSAQKSRYSEIASFAKFFIMVTLQKSTPEIQKAVYEVVTEKSIAFDDQDNLTDDQKKSYETFYASLSMENFQEFLKGKGLSFIDGRRPAPNKSSDYELVSDILMFTRKSYEFSALKNLTQDDIEQLRRPGAQLAQGEVTLNAIELESIMRPRRKAHALFDEVKTLECIIQNSAIRSLITKDCASSEKIQETTKQLGLCQKQLDDINKKLIELESEISAQATAAAQEAEHKFLEAGGLQALGKSPKNVKQAQERALRTCKEGREKIQTINQGLLPQYKTYLMVFTGETRAEEKALLNTLGLSSIPSYTDRFIQVAFSNTGTHFTKAKEMEKLITEFEALDEHTKKLNFSDVASGNIGEKIVNSFPENGDWRFKQACILFVNHVLNVCPEEMEPNLEQFEMLSEDDKKSIQAFVGLHRRYHPDKPKAFNLGYHTVANFSELIGREPNHYPYLLESNFSAPKKTAQPKSPGGIHAAEESKEEEKAVAKVIDPEKEETSPGKLKDWQNTVLKIAGTSDFLTKGDARFDAMVKFLQVSLCSNLGLTYLRISDVGALKAICSIFLAEEGRSKQKEYFHHPIQINNTQIHLYPSKGQEPDSWAVRVEKLATYFSALVETLRPYRTEYNIGFIRLWDRTEAEKVSKVIGRDPVLRVGIGTPGQIVLTDADGQNRPIDLDKNKAVLRYIRKELVLVDYDHLVKAKNEANKIFQAAQSRYQVGYAVYNPESVERDVGGSESALQRAARIAREQHQQHEQEARQQALHEQAERRRAQQTQEAKDAERREAEQQEEAKHPQANTQSTEATPAASNDPSRHFIVWGQPTEDENQVPERAEAVARRSSWEVEATRTRGLALEHSSPKEFMVNLICKAILTATPIKITHRNPATVKKVQSIATRIFEQTCKGKRIDADHLPIPLLQAVYIATFEQKWNKVSKITGSRILSAKKLRETLTPKHIEAALEKENQHASNTTFGKIVQIFKEAQFDLHPDVNQYRLSRNQSAG